MTSRRRSLGTSSCDKGTSPITFSDNLEYGVVISGTMVVERVSPQQQQQLAVADSPSFDTQKQIHQRQQSTQATSNEPPQLLSPPEYLNNPIIE